MATKTFSYGVYHLPEETERRLGQMLHLAHQYYNQVVESENVRRANLEAARRSLSPAYAAAAAVVAERQAAVDAAVEAARRAKAVGRTAVAPDAERAAITAARAALREAWAVQRVAARDLHKTDEWKAARRAEDNAFIVRYKALYAASPLWWPTKNVTAVDVERAAADTPVGPLRFRRWSRHGRLSTQIQGGLPTADVTAGTSQHVRVTREPGKRKRATIQIRIGSDGRQPVFVSLPFAFHRPLPANGTVKWVHIVRRQGWHYYPGRDRPPTPRDDWSVQFSVEYPDVPVTPKPGRIGVDVGWRLRPDDALRVAYFVDDAGRRGEVCLDRATLVLWEKREEAQGQRDILFNAIRDRLAAWVAANADRLPTAFLEATATVGQWRSISRLHGLLHRWAELVTPSGDGQLADTDDIVRQHAELLEWQRADVKLEMAFVASGLAAERKRLDLYRKFAAEIGERYGTIAVEDLKVADMRRDPLPESDEGQAVQVRWRNAAAVGLLLQCIGQQGRATVVRLDPASTTSACHACGSEQTFDRGRLRHTCTACETEWDQDENAARNLLGRLDEQAEADGSTDTPSGDGQLADGDEAIATVNKPKKKISRGRRPKSGSQMTT